VSRLKKRLRLEEPFVVSSGEEKLRSPIREYLDAHQIPYAFFDDKDGAWTCLVRNLGTGHGVTTESDRRPVPVGRRDEPSEEPMDEAELQRIREQTGLDITVATEERLGDGPPQEVRRY
jgi:hypothetical protein